MLFATSDYGTAVAIVLLIYAAWFIVILIAGIGSWCCIRLLREEGDVPEARRFGITLLLICASLPLGCCIGPGCARRAGAPGGSAGPKGPAGRDQAWLPSLRA